MKKNILLLLSVLFGLAACGENETPCTALIGGGSYCLQPTTSLAPFETQQKVEARLRNRRETMIAEIENDATALHFIGLTPFGHTMLQVSYNNSEVLATTLPDRRISPTLLIALLQIALWPADSIRNGLEAPLTLEESGGQRRIINQGETTLSIDYTGDRPPYRRMILNIHAAYLELDIETLAVTGNEP